MPDIFTFIANDITRLDFKKGDGFVVTGLIRSGQIQKNDEIWIITPNDIKETEIYLLEKDGEIINSAQYGDHVHISMIGIHPQIAMQTDDNYNISWLSLGLIAPSRTQKDIDEQHDKEIANLRLWLPNPVFEIEQTTAPYLSVLLEKYYKLVYIDEYDTIEGIEDFESEIYRFIRKKLPEYDENLAKHIISELIKKELFSE